MKNTNIITINNFFTTTRTKSSIKNRIKSNNKLSMIHFFYVGACNLMFYMFYNKYRYNTYKNSNPTRTPKNIFIQIHIISKIKGASRIADTHIKIYSKVAKKRVTYNEH